MIYDASFIYRYQFNPMYYQTTVAGQVLLKALTNLPHTDFTLCKCLIDLNKVSICMYTLDIPYTLNRMSLSPKFKQALQFMKLRSIVN